MAAANATLFTASALAADDNRDGTGNGSWSEEKGRMASQFHGTNGKSGAKIDGQHKVEVITRKSARVLVSALSAALKDMCRINSH
jgi:hypothetical protein